jgi:ATPase subunit of ABC transporter with duplicated ATPase domains
MQATSLMNMLMDLETPDSGTIKFGITVNPQYLPVDHQAFFKERVTLVDWLRPYSKDQAESYLRGWLGRMLFSGEEALKLAHVLSGGEKVRCMLARLMLNAGNMILLDEPTNHLDLEAITALNKGLIQYKGVLVFSSHDHELIQTVANRIFYFDGEHFIDRRSTYEEFIEWLKEK